MGDDVELLAAKSKGKVKKAAKTAKKAMKKAKKAKKKAKKALKPKKKKKKVSKIAKGKFRKVLVLRGKKEKTVGGLKASDLIKNKNGKVVSKKASAKAKKSPWIAAVTAARSALKLKGFVAIKKGSPLYAKAKSLYKPKSDIELLAGEDAPEGEDEEEQDDDEEQEQEEQDVDEEQEQDDDESQDDTELLAAKAKKSKGKGKVAKAATAAKAAVKKAIKSTKKAKKAAPKEDEEEQELQAQLFEVVSTQAAAGGIILCIAGLGVIFAVLRFRSGFSTSFSEPLLVDKV